MRCLVEVVVCSVEDAVAAERAGVNRLELCQAIELGGLTPSLGLLDSVLEATRLPVVALLRPRSGGFCYSEGELRVMLRDAAAFHERNVEIATGALLQDHSVDWFALNAIKQTGAKVVLHRAFDLIPDREAVWNKLGVERALTTQPFAKGHVLCGGIRSQNMTEKLIASGAKQVHLGPMRQKEDRTGGPYGDTYPVLDEDEVRRVVTLISSLDRG